MSKKCIHVIVEGDEEFAFFEIVKELGLAKKFELIVENAHGFGNVSPLLEGYVQLYDMDCIFAVYDVDGKTDDGSPFNSVQNSLLNFFGDQQKVDAVSLCTNPNILQMFLLGCDSLNKVSLKSTSKEENTCIVNKYWPDIGKTCQGCNNHEVTKYYDANKWQLDIIKNSYIYNTYNYDTLLVNANALPLDYTKKIPAGNLYPFLKALRDGDETYFENYRKIMEQ